MILPNEKRAVLANDNVVSILHDSADRPDSGKVSSPEQVFSPPLPSSKVRVARLTVVLPSAKVVSTFYVQLLALFPPGPRSRK
jgi:hypothetical protein